MAWDAGSIRLSLLIPTVGRSGELWDTVTAIQDQMLSDEELLILDQNRPPLAWPDSLSRDKRIHRVNLYPPSLTRARNAALEKAKHDFAVFLDDDILPSRDMLKRFREAAARQPHAVWTGKITQQDRPRQDSPASPDVGRVDLDSGAIVTDYGHPPAGPVPFFAGGLCLLPWHRMKALAAGPWYSPLFRGAAQGEEIDLALRLKVLGIPILCDPGIAMHHWKAPVGGCRSPHFQKRFAADESFNRGLFWGRHGRLHAWPMFLRRMKGFIEFHSRTRSLAGLRHSPLAFLCLGWSLFQGLAAGLGSRVFMRQAAKADLITPMVQAKADLPPG